MLIRLLFLLFCIFPFTQILPLNTYNQPYAFLMGLVILGLTPRTFKYLLPADLLFLAWIAIIGILFYAIVLLSGIEMRELQYLFSYLSPLVIVTVFVLLLNENIEMVKKCLTFGIIVWLSVSLIQMFFDPSFLTFLVSDKEELGTNILASGRGILGMAPEPTHNGFHFFIMGSVLYAIGGKKWLAVLSILASVLLARSSSVVLAAGIGSFLWAMLRPVKNSWYFAAIGVAVVFGFTLLIYLDDQTRIGILVNSLLDDGLRIVYRDASVNMRIAGLYLPVKETFSTWLWPQGMSIEAWLEIRWKLLAENPWVFDLSHGGPASGFGLLLLQGGVLGLPPVMYFYKRLVFDKRNTLDGALFASCFMIFMSCLYLATPSFGVVLGAAIYLYRSKLNPKNSYANGLHVQKSLNITPPLRHS